MKQLRFKAISVAAIIMAAGFMFALDLRGQATQPAVAGNVNISSLPVSAKKFIVKHFNGIAITECEKGFLSGKFDVELADDTDMEFDSKGNIIEIDAGNRAVLSASLLKDILPAKAYTELEKRGELNIVESVKRISRGYKVELEKSGPDEIIFSPDGTFLSIH